MFSSSHQKLNKLHYLKTLLRLKIFFNLPDIILKNCGLGPWSRPFPFLASRGSIARKTSHQLFADDTCFLIRDTSLGGLERLCNSELLHVCRRMTSTRLALNSYKTQALLISH